MRKLLFTIISLLSASLSLAAVNINTATADELRTLPGIGQQKALSIVEYRNEHGAFGTIEEIMKVKGIGNGIFEKLKNDIEVDSKTVSIEKKAIPAVKP